jgi:hypothetical protein
MRPGRLDRIIYSTITLMSVLIIYDGWQTLTIPGVVAVITGPVLAMFLSHVFSAALAQHVTLGRRLTLAEWAGVIGAEAPFLLIAVPPLAILAVLNLSGVSLTTAIKVMIWIGTASLGFWSGLAGYRARLRGGPLAVVVLAGLLIGRVVLTLQIFLQPGKAF